MVLVFRPFGGFTNKVLRRALEHGPWHTYRAFVDGPYGGMQRRIEAFIRAARTAESEAREAGTHEITGRPADLNPAAAPATASPANQTSPAS